MAIRRFAIQITGTSGLLLSNNAPSDPLSEAAKTKKHFTSKRTKADQDHENLRVIDWVYSGYWKVPGEVHIDDTDNAVTFEGFAGLYMPSQNFQRCLRNGATAFKLGKEVERAVVVENEAPIVYDGPVSAEELIKDPRFMLTSPVVRQKVTNWVTRLLIPSWSCAFVLSDDDDRVSAEALDRIAQAAGQFEGIGTWRPRYGRFKPQPLVELEF